MVVLCALVPIQAFAQPGTVLGEQKISNTAGGFAGILDNFDFFGSSVTALGDLDGPGPSVLALAVGSPTDDDGAADAGAVWILFLDASGSVVSQQKISATSGGFAGPLHPSDNFGQAVAGLGDLSGDGTIELAVGAPRDDDLGTATSGGDRGAVYILSLNTDGTVAAEQKISASAGGFTGTLNTADRFGSSVAAAGDIDGDGRTDIVVGAKLDNDGGADRGAVWVLFLDVDGTVFSEQKISSLTGSFTGVLDNGDNFGSSVTSIGDLNGDTIPDIVVGAELDDDGSDALSNVGAAWVLFLAADGTVSSHQKISAVAGGFTGLLDRNDNFGSSVATIGDIDGDTVPELAVGAMKDDDGGTDNGSVWVLFMNNDGTVASEQKISAAAGGFIGPLGSGDNFGSSAAAIGDIDGDGIKDLAVGARFTDDGGSLTGAVWVLGLDGQVATCGNGIVEGAEACDDGNLLDGDCCSSTCGFDPAGTHCVDNDLCNGTEVCDGAGTCLNGPALNCNDSNLCTNDSCQPAIGCINAPNTDPCSDGNACTTGDACVNGACTGQAPLNCNDGNPCTQDSCDDLAGCVFLAQPIMQCRVAEKGKLEVEDSINDDEDEIEWKWQKGQETVSADLGDPTLDTSYTLCIYDQGGGLTTLATSLTVDPDGGWKSKGSKGWRYKDRSGLQDGVRKLKLRTGVDGKARIDLKAEGVNVPIPVPVSAGQMFNQDPNVIVQMVNSLGKCWETEVVPKVEFDD